MGMVIYKRVTNVYEIPSDILVNCIGRGVIVTEGNPPLLEVNAGEGLGFDNRGRLIADAEVHRAKAGKGLSYDDCNTLNVNVNCESGLRVNEDNQLEIFRKVVGDNCEKITNLTDASLSLCSNKLVLQKKYTEYHIIRDSSGNIVDLRVGDSYVKEDKVDITDCGYHGYGYRGCGISSRLSTKTSPNFYIK